MLVLQHSKYTNEDTFISILKEEHRDLFPSFKSNNEELNDFLVTDAIEYHRLHLGLTYLLFSKENEDKIITYTTLSMGALKLPSKKEEFVFQGKKLQDYPKDFPNQFPALLIGKLATDKNEEGKGAASILVDFAIKVALETREKIGCTFVVAHAYAEPKVVEWYKKKGFKTYIQDIEKRETVPMYFEL